MGAHSIAFGARSTSVKRKFSFFPVTLQKAAETVTRPAFKYRGLAHARLVSDWRHIAGSVLAEKALPLNIRFPKGQKDGGTLYLAVASGWGLEVQHLEPIILEKIATYFGYRAIAKIHITQRPLPLPIAKKKTPPPPPLPAQAQKKLEGAVEGITDPTLKRALERLGGGIFSKIH
jgi:hypothetical protein